MRESIFAKLGVTTRAEGSARPTALVWRMWGQLHREWRDLAVLAHEDSGRKCGRRCQLALIEAVTIGWATGVVQAVAAGGWTMKVFGSMWPVCAARCITTPG